MNNKKEIFFQCLLERKTENATITTTSWIPKKYAKKDKYIQLREKKEDGYTEWIDGWKVISICSKSLKENVPDIRKSIKTHIARTGDNLPKFMPKD